MPDLKTKYSEAESLPAVAASAVSGGRLVKLASGSQNAKVSAEHTAAATDYALGVARYDAAAGEEFAYKRGGVVYLVASAAISADADVVPAADGQVAAASGAAGERVVGHSLAAASTAGDLVPVLLHL